MLAAHVCEINSGDTPDLARTNSTSLVVTIASCVRKCGLEFRGAFLIFSMKEAAKKTNMGR